MRMQIQIRIHIHIPQVSYPLGSILECQLWRLALQSAVRARWQTVLEASIIPEPEIYQLHVRAKQLPRKGSALSRFLVLSDGSIYSIGREGGGLRAVQWSVATGGLRSLSQSELKDRRALSYPYGLVLRWSSAHIEAPKRGRGGGQPAEGESTVFALKGRGDLEAMTAALCQAYKHATGTPLAVERM